MGLTIAGVLIVGLVVSQATVDALLGQGVSPTTVGDVAVRLVDVTGPGPFVCGDTCCGPLSPTLTGTHIHLTVDATTFAPDGFTLGDAAPDLGLAGPPRELRWRWCALAVCGCHPSQVGS